MGGEQWLLDDRRKEGATGAKRLARARGKRGKRGARARGKRARGAKKRARGTCEVLNKVRRGLKNGKKGTPIEFLLYLCGHYGIYVTRGLRQARSRTA
jgi:hypothetical protein